MIITDTFPMDHAKMAILLAFQTLAVCLRSRRPFVRIKPGVPSFNNLRVTHGVSGTPKPNQISDNCRFLADARLTFPPTSEVRT